MANKSIAEKIKQKALKSDWKAKAEFRVENEEWLDISFSIAVKVNAAIIKNKISQKELSLKLNCSPQYVSKLLKGKEKLNIETIVKLQNALSIKLIEIHTEVSKLDIHGYQQRIFEEEILENVAIVSVRQPYVINNQYQRFNRVFNNNNIKWQQKATLHTDC